VGNVVTGQGNIRVSLIHSRDVTNQLIERLPALTESEMATVEQRIRAQQERVGYTGDYDSWIARVTPDDME